jgi:hypothetical protein
MSQRVRADLLGDPRAAGYPPDDPGGAVPVQPPSVCGEEERPFSALADRQVDRPGGARGERDGDDLAALAGDDQGPVAAFQAQVLDVRAGRLGHAQAVEREQGDQRVLGGRAEPGGDQERAELVAVQGGGVRLVVQPRPPDVRGRRMLQKLFLDGVLVESGDGTEPSGDGGAGTAPCFQFAGEGLDIGAADGEQRQRAGAAPAGELAQVEGVGLAGQAALPGQVPSERGPLGISEHRLGRDEGRGMGRGGHRGTSRDSRDPGGRAAAGLSGERCPQRTPLDEDELRHDP